MALVAYVQLTEAEADRVIDVLLAAGAEEVELIDGPLLLGLFHRSDPEALRSALDQALAGLGAALAKIEEAELLDWDSVWAPSPRPFTVGPLTIAPGAEAAAGDLALELGAFGSGLHPSTRLCLDRLVAYRPRGALLDFGTGTGILGLAALRLGAARAVGVEIDEAAIEVARRNAARNGLSDRFVVTSAPLGALGTFDRIVANVIGAPLVGVADQLARALGSGGEMSLAGFPVGQADEVAAAFTNVGLRRLHDAEEDGWGRIDLSAPW